MYFETGALDTGAFDTGALETGALETGAFDTGAFDTGAFDTGALDTGAFDTGAFETKLRDRATFAALFVIWMLAVTLAGASGEVLRELRLPINDFFWMAILNVLLNLVFSASWIAPVRLRPHLLRFNGQTQKSPERA
ncbi:MAG: hypothetical protein WA399_05495 [Acidobacteriaceae bacterium]|jgi:hypothetical protein